MNIVMRVLVTPQQNKRDFSDLFLQKLLGAIPQSGEWLLYTLKQTFRQFAKLARSTTI